MFLRAIRQVVIPSSVASISPGMPRKSSDGVVPVAFGAAKPGDASADFYRDDHRRIWRHISRLMTQQSRATQAPLRAATGARGLRCND